MDGTRSREDIGPSDTVTSGGGKSDGQRRVSSCSVHTDNDDRIDRARALEAEPLGPVGPP